MELCVYSGDRSAAGRKDNKWWDPVGANVPFTAFNLLEFTVFGDLVFYVTDLKPICKEIQNLVHLRYLNMIKHCLFNLTTVPKLIKFNRAM